jgi:hypothetical protein
VANASKACGRCPGSTYPNALLGADACHARCSSGSIATSFYDDGTVDCEECPEDTYQVGTLALRWRATCPSVLAFPSR